MRGARRREQTPDAAIFPLLSSHQATAGGWIPPKNAALPQRNQLDDQRSEDRDRLRADALRSRLQATGFKRSIVQAQLFPDASNQREAANARPEQLLSTGNARVSTAGRPRIHADNNADNRPLVPSLHPTGGALIPSRPTTSSSMASRSGRQGQQAVPQSAREPYSASKLSDVEPQKVPMTARDRYYVEKRVSTAPSPSLLRGNKRRPLRPSPQDDAHSSGEHSHQANVQLSHHSKGAAWKDEDVSRYEPKVETAELPKRHELLSRTGDFKTLTESIAEQMKTREAAQRGSGGLESYSAAAEFYDPVGGAAVPRDSFLYLHRVDSNPYNLALTHHAHINPDDYYTVSRLGVTHFAHNSSEFMTMEKFERENYLYSLIVKVCGVLCDLIVRILANLGWRVLIWRSCHSSSDTGSGSGSCCGSML